MSLSIRNWTTADLELLRTLLSDASVRSQFDAFQGPNGLEHKLHDPRLAQRSVQLAFVDGEPAGFALAWVLPNPGMMWFMFRVGVLERFRRRGIATRLAQALLVFAERERAGEPADVAGSAWLPCDEAEGFAASLGFTHQRWFWLMERPRGANRASVWPAGVETRVFDGSEEMLRDYTGVYNDSFARHYRYVVATLEIIRTYAADPAFRREGLLLAYRDGACVGFCRNELHAERGEIGTLGVAHAARGIGLGRALLRWGVGWLEANSTLPVTLMVDGENENALGLYRSEGFAISRTRRIWGRAAVSR